tara:strand:+ start:1328 stop:4195 length:2868 start_codon:yes stop_codon:yes gene_type:complete
MILSIFKKKTMSSNYGIDKDIETLCTNQLTTFSFFNTIKKYINIDKLEELIRIISVYKFAKNSNNYNSLITILTDFDNNDVFDEYEIDNIILIFRKMVNMYHKIKKDPKDLFRYGVLNYNNLICRKDIMKFFKHFSKLIDFSSYEYGLRRTELCEDICLYGTLNLLFFFEKHKLEIPVDYYKDLLIEKSYFNNKDNRLFYEILNRFKIHNIKFYNFDFLKKQYVSRRHNMKKINALMKFTPNSMSQIISLLIHDINSLRIEQLTTVLDRYNFKINVLTDYEIRLIKFDKLKNNKLFEKLLNKIESNKLKEKIKLEYIYYFVKKNNLRINNYCLKIMNKYLGTNNKLLAKKMFNMLLFSSNLGIKDNTDKQEMINFIHNLNEYKQDYIITSWWYSIDIKILINLFFCGIDIIKVLKNTVYNCQDYFKERFINNMILLFKNDKILKYINTQRLLKRIICNHRKKRKIVFNNILSNIRIPTKKELIKNKRTIPVHLHPLSIIKLLSNEKIYISPKADGIYESINLSFYYPYINLFKIRRMNFESELITIQNKTINLVFGNYDIILLLRKEFKYIDDNRNYVANNESEFMTIMETEKKCFRSFIDKSNDNLWYPKISVKINYNVRLEDLEKYKNSCYFDTDGWIINEKFKLKHREHMTIDLKNTQYGFKDREGNVYKNVKSVDNVDDKIYRCYYGDIWEPRDLREDKNYPNSREVIENIINYSEGIWDYEYVQNLYDKYFKSNANNYYYGKHKICTFRHLIPKYHRVINKYLSRNKSVIDLCCGYSGYFYRSKMKIKDYIGFDINTNVNELLFNINANWNSLYRLFYGKNLEKYDVILCNNAIQNSHDLEHFSNNVDTISHVGSRLIIRFLDWDSMQTMNEASYNENYVRIINENKIKYYYSHCHNEPIIEKVYSSNDIIESLKNEWTLESISEYKEDNKHCDFQKYLHFFKIAIFVKN